MSSKLQSVMKMTVHFYDEAREPDVVVCGQWEYLQAQRKYGKTLAEAGESADLEYMSFVTFRAAVRQGLVDSDTSFEQWVQTVVAIEPVEDEKKDGAQAKGESPAPLGE